MRIGSVQGSLFLLAALSGFTTAICQAQDYAIAHVTVINPGAGKPDPI
jgi:hypothetical protein